MSKKLERSRDKEIEDEKRLYLLDYRNKNKNKIEFETKKNNPAKKNYEIINLKDSPVHKNKEEDEENLDNESDEYYEEEDEEGGEIEDDDEEEINSEFQRSKKRKIENTIGKWSRKKSDIKEIENDDSLFSADIVITKPENKNDRNIDISNKDNSNNVITLDTKNNYKKANFFTTPIGIPNQGKKVSSTGEQKNISNYFNVNNNQKDFRIEYNVMNNDNINLNTSNNNINNSTPISSENKVNTNFLNPNLELKKNYQSNANYFYQSLNQQQFNKDKFIAPEIFNKNILFLLIKSKVIRYHLKSFPDENILIFLQEKLRQYLKIYLKRLITISRIRNANFNLYSNNPSGQTHFKFRTYNWALSKENEKINVAFSPSKVFDILFTSNFKKRFDLIEEYEELYNKKTKFEKLSSCKEKYEESNKTKGIESSIKITDGPNPTIKLLPGRRTKKKNNTFFKEMRKKIDQTKKKEDLNKQKSFTKNTLDTFLNDSNINNKNMSLSSLPNLIDGGSNNMLDMSSKMSDTMSHNNFSYTNNYISSTQNEISMNIFTYFDPTKDGKIDGRQKKRINFKDFIFLLENSNEYIPNKILLLNKASIENSKNK